MIVKLLFDNLNFSFCRRGQINLATYQPAIDAETLIWPYKPGVADGDSAPTLLATLKERLLQIPIELFPTPAQLGSHLGFRVVKAPLPFPRWGWTWYESKLIEVNGWLPEGLLNLTIAHEDCHVILGPITHGGRPFVREKIERVCNWGAGEIFRRLGWQSTQEMALYSQRFRLAIQLYYFYKPQTVA